MFRDFLALFADSVLPQALGIAWDLWPVWAPLLVIYFSFNSWLSYKRTEWLAEQKKLLLEIRLPNELVKSPAPMEVFLQSLHQGLFGNFSEVFLKGKVTSWSSLELVSHGGRVHFYIWIFANQRKIVENQLYAQFPNIEVHEVPDYALGIHYDLEKYKFGNFNHIVLTKEDVYPIKTYIDYGLDKNPDEEFKNDPISPLIEYLGSLQDGEHAWIQILLQAHGKKGVKHGYLIPRPDWKERAEKEIKNILEKAKFKGKEAKEATAMMLSEAQKDTIKAIERSIEKTAFETMIRVTYFAEKDKFNPVNIGGLLGGFKQFSSNTLNGFRPGKGAGYEYIWQDPWENRKKKNEQKFLDAYKKRAIFNEHLGLLHDNPYILTTEEIATLYHFPSSMVAATPTLSRIPSKKAEAPANLPV